VASTFLDALTLARFAIFLRPISGVLYLPGYKGAAFRGGFGYAFKSIACPTHGVDCVHARLGDTCVYSAVFETPVPADSVVMRKYTHAPHPFVLTPPLDRRASFTAEHELRLELVLIGRAVHWLAYFICSIEELGRRGIGPAKSRYGVERVESLPYRDALGSGHGSIVYDGGQRKVVGVPQVIRGGELSEGCDNTGKATLSFLTPARVVSQDHLANELPFVTLFRTLLRRLALLSYFHCGQTAEPEWMREAIGAAQEVRLASSELRWRDWQRYSTRQQARMKLGGLVGKISYEGEMKRFMPFLRAGEFTHLGKATSFGLGKYTLQGA